MLWFHIYILLLNQYNNRLFKIILNQSVLIVNRIGIDFHSGDIFEVILVTPIVIIVFLAMLGKVTSYVINSILENRMKDNYSLPSNQFKKANTPLFILIFSALIFPVLILKIQSFSAIIIGLLNALLITY